MFQPWILTTYAPTVKKSEHLAKAYFKKKKESGHNTTHQVTAMQRAESDPSEDKGDTDNPFTVYMKGMKSSGSTTTTHPLQIYSRS